MKSRTSFFNLTAFKKSLIRYAPVWALYTVFLLLVLFVTSNRESGTMARYVITVTRLAGVGNLIYAGIVAMMLFGDLYKSRLCNALHAFPMRREGWLLTNIAAGLLFSLIPNLFVCVLASIQLEEFAFYIWILFAVAFLQYLFFFDTAVLSALCAGNRLAMAAIYSIIQFVVVLIYFLADVIYQPLLYGVELQTDKFFQFFPLSRMSVTYVDAGTGYGDPKFCGYHTEQWVHLAICAAVGVFSFVLAWLVYRHRHLERAGDFISLRPVAPVFLTIYTIAVGTVLYSFSEMINQPSYFLYGAGIAIGFFTGQMLLNRTVRVFYKKSWLAFCVLAAVLAGSMTLTWMDPLGVRRWVPELDQVESAVLCGADKYYLYENTYEFIPFEMSDPDELAKLQDFHRELYSKKPDSRNSGTYDVSIRYNLKDGRQVKRTYKITNGSALSDRAEMYFSDARYVFQVDDPAVLYEIFAAVTVRLQGWDSSGDKYESFSLQSKDNTEIKGLLDAILADCAAGKMAQSWLYYNGSEQNYYVEFEMSDSPYDALVDKYHVGSLRIRGDATNTISYLNHLYSAHKDDVQNEAYK